MVEEVEDLRYGWGRFRPRILQCLNGPKWFLFFLVIFSAIQGMTVNGFTKLVLPSIERQFQFSSKDLGVIAAGNDASSLILVCFVSFFGGYGNKIRWLGYGAYLTAFGCMLFSLPRFLIGSYYPGAMATNLSFTEQDLCIVKNLSMLERATCISSYNSAWYYMFIFVTAQLIMGAGTAPLYSLGPAYIDENVHPKSMPIYLAFWYAASILGPGLGFVLGGTFLSMFVDIELPTGVNLTPDDPRWVGAWWLGFITGGGVLFLSAFWILGFPAELPGTREMRERAIEKGEIPKKDDKFQGRVKDLLPATKELLKNKVYVFNTLATSSGFLSAGISSFLPKILQDKYAVNSASTGYSIGAAIVPGMFFGILLGGYIVRRFKVRESCRMAAKCLVVFAFIAALGPTAWFIPGCDQIEVAGVGQPYFNSTDSYTGVSAACNRDCACLKSQFNPVCGADGITYLTPCHAGCHATPSASRYVNCSCIPFEVNVTEPNAVQGFCDRGSGCQNFIYFLILILVLLLSVFLQAIPTRTVVLRCVPDNQRAYALGLQFVFFRALGSLPSPIMFGYFFDINCILWGESCGQRGSCFFYDIQRLSSYLGGVGYVLGGITFIFFFISWYFCEKANKKPNTELVPTDDTEKIDLGSVPIELAPDGPESKPSHNLLDKEVSA